MPIRRLHYWTDTPLKPTAEAESFFGARTRPPPTMAALSLRRAAGERDAGSASVDGHVDPEKSAQLGVCRKVAAARDVS